MGEEKTKALSIDEVPGPRPSIPFIGTSWMYMPFIGRYKLENLHEANIDKYYRYGRICREDFVYKRPLIQVYDPEDIEKVLRRQGKYPNRPPNEAAVAFRSSHPEFYNTVGLVNANGKEWYNLRNGITSQLVQPRVVNAFIPKQNLICDDLIKLLKDLSGPDGTVENCMEPLHRMALETTTMLCLEKRMGCLNEKLESGSDAKRLIDASLSLFQAYQSLYFGSQLWKYFTTAAYQQMVDAEFTLYSIVSKYINEAKTQYQVTNLDSDAPLLAHLLHKSNGIDLRDIQAGIVDLITAGIDTSANSITFILMQLSRNMEVQDKLFKEIDEAIGDGEATAETLSQLTYLKACVKEAFRVCPTIPNNVRILNDDTVLSGYLIPKGTTVVCQTMVSSQLNDFVDDADKFIPERWLPGYPTRCGSFTVQPFGSGPRMCPGRRFAEQEIYLTLIKLIQNFRVEFVKEIEIQYLFIITPKAPVTMKFVPRKKN